MLILLIAVLAPFPEAMAGISGTVVDKKTNSIHLAYFDENGFSLRKKYRATLGLVPGDKLAEGDKKTPEGIYFFEEERRPPLLPKKFGPLALTMNFPNAWDKWMNRSGSGIWLHSTDEPDRLSRDLDSLGCVVMKDEDILDLEKRLHHRTSPILVFEDLAAAAPSDEKRKAIKAAIQQWSGAWRAKDFARYKNAYHPAFRAEGGDLKHWLARKERLNRLYKSIQVGIDDLVILSHPKYDAAIFRQTYSSSHRSGAPGKASEGIKILYFTFAEGSPKILSEEYRTGDFSRNRERIADSR